MTYYVIWHSFSTHVSAFATNRDAQAFINKHNGKPHALGNWNLYDVIKGNSVLHEFTETTS